MRRYGVGFVFVLLLGACESGQAGIGDIDDRPPPFRDHGSAVFWSTDDPDPPTEQTFAAHIREFWLPVLLVPSQPPGGEVARLSVEVHNVGFDRFARIAAGSPAGSSWLIVTATSQTAAVDCGPASAPVEIRGTAGCFGSEGPGQLVLSWREGWIHQARWTQDAGLPMDEYLEFFLGWLDDWRAYKP